MNKLTSVITDVAAKRILLPKAEFSYEIQLSGGFMVMLSEELGLPLYTSEAYITLHDKQWRVHERSYRDDSCDPDVEEIIYEHLK